MTVTCVTGKMGAGKNLYAMSVMERYARQRRRIVANFSVNFDPLLGWWERLLGKKAPVAELVSAQPSYNELRALGRGGKREDVAGLLVLDECGPLFNSRAWQEKDRQSVIAWLLHTRKLGWDVLVLVQHVGIIDKQIRTAVIEMGVTVRRLDKLKVLGVLPLPRIHLATERYGTEPNAVRVGIHPFRGGRYFKCYDTQECLIDTGTRSTALSARDERAASGAAVPKGARAPACPIPASSLQAAWLEIASELGVLRSVLPDGYLERLAVQQELLA